VSAGALVLAFLPSAHSFVVALLVLLKLSSAPLPAAVERAFLCSVTEQPLILHTSSAEVRARRYSPQGAAEQGAPKLLLLHGVHAMGIDEPRLMALARAFAQAGMDVLTPELTELTHYRVVPEAVSDIEQLARAWTLETHARSVGVIGISFAGGLALMAAAAQGGKEPIGFVVCVGAHHDLTRVVDFYAGRDVHGPAGERTAVAAHPYGPRVMLRGELTNLFSASDLPLATEALDTYLHDKPQAARQLARGLSAEGRERARVLLDGRSSEQLTRWLLDSAGKQRPQLLAASPRGHLQGLQVPVLLLHGTDDPVVPSIETRYLALEVPEPLLRDVLVTDLLRHAELNQLPAPSRVYRFARFIQRLLAVARTTARLDRKHH
jgi:pimeloyl-ACP methyl ester carboxylesterase